MKKHILKYEDVSRLEGLGWIEYRPFDDFSRNSWIQPSIKANKNFIDMVCYSINYSVWFF